MILYNNYVYIRVPLMKCLEKEEKNNQITFHVGKYIKQELSIHETYIMKNICFRIILCHSTQVEASRNSNRYLLCICQ